MNLEAEVLELKARLTAAELQASHSRRRIRRLSATNVLLAVVVLAFGGATAAYALAPANSVNSASIIDRSIGTPDVKVGAFAGQTILDNSMTGADINESTLVLPKRSRTLDFPPVLAHTCVALNLYSGGPAVADDVVVATPNYTQWPAGLDVHTENSSPGPGGTVGVAVVACSSAAGGQIDPPSTVFKYVVFP